MANNRLYLVHRPSGMAIRLGKHFMEGWYGPPSAEALQEFFDEIYKWDCGVEYWEDLALAMEDTENAPYCVEQGIERKIPARILRAFEEILKNQEVRFYGNPDYIERCRRAKEIQKSWNPQMGDFVLWCGRVEGEKVALVYNVGEDGWLNIITIADKSANRTYHYVSKGDCIWIPRPDQWGIDQMQGVITSFVVSPTRRN